MHNYEQILTPKVSNAIISYESGTTNSFVFELQQWDCLLNVMGYFWKHTWMKVRTNVPLKVGIVSKIAFGKRSAFVNGNSTQVGWWQKNNYHHLFQAEDPRKTFNTSDFEMKDCIEKKAKGATRWHSTPNCSTSFLYHNIKTKFLFKRQIQTKKNLKKDSLARFGADIAF